MTAACNDLRYVLKGFDQAAYQSLVALNQLGPIDFNLRTWQVDVQYLRIKLARENWREVLSDLDMMQRLGKAKTAPESIQQELEAIRAEAEERK